jgi:hypothetical protein
MKEHIYTIPVTEAFAQDCECPLCLCRRQLESEALEYELGAAMMEPDHRILTNQAGFCASHYEKLYNMQKNRLPLGLVLDTHLSAQQAALADTYRKAGERLLRESQENLLQAAKGKLSGKPRAADELTAGLLQTLDRLLADCVICTRVNHTMDQFADTVIWLFFKEPEFRERFEQGMGFCLPDFRLLLRVADKSLSAQKKAMFLRSLLPLMVENLARVQADVNWFTQMFDHRNRDADWKQSRDALSRAVLKLAGPLDLQ